MVADSYRPTRPIMDPIELAKHQVGSHGRDYRVSQDGYEDMAAAKKDGWQVVASWGQEGWDLGSWPYVAVYRRTKDGSFQVQLIVEGDHTVYAFASEADAEAAIDYLFLTFSVEESWSPVKPSERSRIGGPAFQVESRFRGPFSWGRCKDTTGDA